MAVLPSYQNKGIGSALVRACLQRGGELGFGAVVVLGHPGYHTHFGFRPSHRFDVACEHGAPAETFMAVELLPAYLDGVKGTVQYHAAFDDV
jgi:putative acetyltransferase